MEIGLFLQTTGVRHNQGSACQKSVHLHITDRIDHGDALEYQAVAIEGLVCARMHREDHGLAVRRLFDIAAKLGKPARIVGILGTVKGEQHIVSLGETSLLSDARTLASGSTGEQRGVIHDIPNEVNARRDAFRFQVIDRRLGRTEQQRTHMVRQDTIHFFWHAPIERSKAGLDVIDGNVQLGRGKRPSKRRIGVAVNQNSVRLLVQKDLLDRLQHAPGHLAVMAAGNTEIMIWFLDRQLVEELRGHALVEMLACVNQDMLDPFSRRERPPDHRRLNELRSRPDDCNQPHHAASFVADGS